MGFEPQQPRSHLDSVNDFADRMAKGLEEAKSALSKAKDEYAMYYNRRREPAPEFEVGDRVWLDASDIRTTRPSAKLSHRRLGPFAVEAKVGHGAYRITLPFSLRRLHPVFPVVKLTLAPPDPIPGRVAAPPPPLVLVNGEPEYVVEKVLNSRMRYNRLEYLVKWKGYDVSENSWEVHTDVFAPLETSKFHLDFPNAPRRINAASFDYIAFTKADLSPNWRPHVGSPCPEGGVTVRGLPPRPPPLPFDSSHHPLAPDTSSKPSTRPRRTPKPFEAPDARSNAFERLRTPSTISAPLREVS